MVEFFMLKVGTLLSVDGLHSRPPWPRALPSPATTGRLLSWISRAENGRVHLDITQTPFNNHSLSNPGSSACNQAYHHNTNDQDVKLIKSLKRTRGKTQNVSGKKA
ncbi:MAG: hypothetical protein DI535_24080 [Citrobacter freundii]|nr:MAG: hypothetical protein DI535_24080 [Citrobacter freundii]